MILWQIEPQRAGNNSLLPQWHRAVQASVMGEGWKFDWSHFMASVPNYDHNSLTNRSRFLASVQGLAELKKEAKEAK
ncbi:hypothetical protein LOAG_07201 [Loa loa]|uniref:Uncharacterized protein n=1 Tax=Loa loa TaxID=7209 RepID=A0A1S0TWS5_LOALO|nr:hypothetical protein LOAG_07201 [Loa loa]EFO21288.1 hypothetical protein LOAG_07201 [Loa loa]